MTVNVEEDIVRVVILDTAGVYVQIYDQGYFNKSLVKDIQQQYSNTAYRQVLVLN